MKVICIAIFLLGLVFVPNVQSISEPVHCRRVNHDGTVNIEYLARNFVHEMALLEPGQIYSLNYTYMHNLQPGVTAYEPYVPANPFLSNPSYQVNRRESNMANCYYVFHKKEEPYTGHHIFDSWLSIINREQRLTQAQPGGGVEIFPQGYEVAVAENPMFIHAGIPQLKMRSFNIGRNAVFTSISTPLPDGGELAVLAEAYSFPESAFGTGDFSTAAYTNGILLGTGNFYPELWPIDRTTITCSEHPEGSEEARHCAAFAAYLEGRTTLLPDPYAVASGISNYLVHTYIEEGVSAKRANEPLRMSNDPLNFIGSIVDNLDLESFSLDNLQAE